MNERVGILHKQAMEFSNNTGTTHFEYMMYAEKFAELIIKDCLYQLNHEAEHLDDEGQDIRADGIQSGIARIKTHFGVK